MAKSGQEFVTTIREHIGGRSDKNAVILNAVNNALRRISALPNHHFRTVCSLFSYTLTTGYEMFSLPDSTRSIFGVWLLDGGISYTLRQLSMRRFQEMFLDGVTTPTTRPSYFAMFGAWWQTDTKVDSDYTGYMLVSTYPAELTLTGTHTLGSTLEPAIEACATSEAMMDIENFDAAAIWEAKYKLLIKEFAAAERTMPAWAPTLSPIPSLSGGAQYEDPLDPFGGSD